MPLRELRTRLRIIGRRLGFDREWYLVFLAALIGLVMSVVAMAFILPLRAVEHFAEQADRELLWWLVPIAPVVGAFLAGVVHHVIPSGGEGPGVTKVMYAIHRRKARLHWYTGARKWIASTLTIGSGGSAGAEGPIVTIGSVIGSITGRLFRTTSQNTATLLGCGAAAGMASVFNAPIAGVFFVMEILLRDFSLRTFTPIVIASVISAAFTQAVLGNDPLFDATALFTRAAESNVEVESFLWLEIPNYLILGILCGIMAALFIKALYKVMDFFHAMPVHPVLKPAIGAAGLGLLGLGYLWFARSEVGMPDFYGNGYPVVKELLRPDMYYADAANRELKPVTVVLLGLIAMGLLKTLATCLTIGSGGAGGLFAPSLLIGASVGAAFGYIVNWIGWFPAASPAHYALVGMAAMVAATTHAPLTAILIVYEITQSYQIILPLMFAAVISTIAARLVYRESVYTVKLTGQGVRIGAMSDLTILRRLSVHDVPLVAPVFVHPEDSAQRLLELSERLSVNDFVVTDRSDRYLGMVTGSDLKEALVYREAIPLLQVSELQRSDLPVISPDDTLDVVLDKFVLHDVNSLVVVNAPQDDAVLGLITRSRLMHRYQSALTRD